MRIALGVEYDGHEFYGWQAQANLATVQGHLESALSKIADEPISVVCAGRTDAGVHALGQVVHFDTNKTRLPRAWVMGTNTYLPATIAVRWAEVVDEQFHARFSALSRAYRYVIYQHSARSAILARRATWHYETLDVEQMQLASHYLLGEQDFTSFRSSECQSKTPMRNVMAVTVKRWQEYVLIDIEANAFLHHMVRNIVGVLVEVGTKRAEPTWVNDVLLAKDRRLAAETAPATGLYLMRVTYPLPYLFSHASSFPI